MPTREAKASQSQFIDAAPDDDSIAGSRFKFGILPAELAGTAPGFLEPLADDELALWEGSAEATQP